MDVIATDRLPGKGAVDLYLYDVVTAIDSAGNITDRHNFEWSFWVTHDRRNVRTVEGYRTNWWVPAAEAEDIVRAQKRGENACRSHRGWVRF